MHRIPSWKPRRPKIHRRVKRGGGRLHLVNAALKLPVLVVAVLGSADVYRAAVKHPDGNGLPVVGVVGVEKLEIATSFSK